MEGPLWFRVEVGLPGSDGARVLERRLGVERAWSFTFSMWDWFIQKHPEGQITGPDAAYLIARGAGWMADPDAFCAAMIAAGYLAEVTEGYRVKGWKEWAGYHFEVRAKSLTRKKRSRAGHQRDVTVTSQGHEGGHACDPSLLSVSESLASRGGVGERRKRASPLPRKTDRLASTLPATTELLRALDAGGFEADYPATETREAVEAAVNRVTVPVAAKRVLDAVGRIRAAGDTPKRWLGWHLDAIEGARAPPAGRGPQPVGSDWTKTLAET